MTLTFTIDKIETQGEHKSVHFIHYTMSGTDDNNKTGSIKSVVGFNLKEESAAGFIPFADITEANAKDWIKFALTPKHLENTYVDDNGHLQGDETGKDLWPEVEQGLKKQIEQVIAEEEAKNETNLPWA